MIDQLSNIDEKIHRLKKKREKVQTQQAIFFMREVQKIFEGGFSAEMALGILSETWNAASEKQQAEWKKRGATFRPSSVQKSSKKAHTPDAASQQS